MKIEVNMKDRDGKDIEIGDTVELFDWGIKNNQSLGIVRIYWDKNEGRISCDPMIVEDAFDFWSKALPRSKWVSK